MATEKTADSPDAPSKCPACGRFGKFWARVNEARIDRCSTCGHGFVWPRPSRIRANQFYMSLELGEALSDHDYRRRQFSGRHEPAMIGRRLARLGKRHGALLDVGAGEGRFTYWFSDHGFDVTPLEINPGLANSLAAATGRDVVREPFELWTPPDGSRFDVIVISQVLEHVADAGLWLGHAAELLSEDGVLFVSVPSFESLLVRTLGAAEGNINPPTHVNFFTMASLVALGADKGLAPAFQNTPNVLPAGAAMDAAAGSLRQLPRAAGHLAGLAAWAGLAATAPFGMGRFLHVYFRRAASS